MRLQVLDRAKRLFRTDVVSLLESSTANRLRYCQVTERDTESKYAQLVPSAKAMGPRLASLGLLAWPKTFVGASLWMRIYQVAFSGILVALPVGGWR